MTEIRPSELANRIQANDDDLLVLDIRHGSSYDDWHIPGSVNVDVYDELANDPDSAKDALEDLPDDKEIVTICAEGVVSQTATEVLEDMGYTAVTMTDGMAGWSRVHRRASVPVDIVGTIVQITRPGKGCLSHAIISNGEAVIFDPSHYLEQYEAVLQDYDAELVGVFDSHAHADHVSGAADLAQRYSVPYYLHPNDALATDNTPIKDGRNLQVGAIDIEVLHTPGHSEGSVSFDIDGEALLTGDTLFHGSVGRVELGVEAGIESTDVEQNAEILYESLQRLLEYPSDTVILPAHDPRSPEPPVTATLDEVEAQNDELSRSREQFVQDLVADVADQPPNFTRVKRTNVGLESVPVDERARLELGPNNCAAE